MLLDVSGVDAVRNGGHTKRAVGRAANRNSTRIADETPVPLSRAARGFQVRQLEVKAGRFVAVYDPAALFPDPLALPSRKSERTSGALDREMYERNVRILLGFRFDPLPGGF